MRSAVVQSALTAALANEEAAEQPVATRAPAAKRVEPVIDPLLTVPTVAERLGYCASQVYEMLRAGRLPAVRDRKFVRVRESALAKFIADHERRGPLPKRVSDMLRSSHDRQRVKTTPPATRDDAAGARPTDRGSPGHRGEMGERNGRDS